MFLEVTQSHPPVHALDLIFPLIKPSPEDLSQPFIGLYCHPDFKKTQTLLSKQRVIPTLGA